MASDDQQVGVKISVFPTASDINSEDLVTGLKNRVNTNFTFGTIINWFRRSVSNLYIALSEKGAPNGVASLDLNGHVYGSQLPFSQVNPLIDGSASPGTSTAVARNDHRHPTDVTRLAASEKGAANGVASLGADGKVPSAQLPTIPSASSATPQNLGTAAAGSSSDYSRADHVHNKPTASDVGAQPTITASGILKGDGAGGVSAAVAGTDYATPAQLADKANQAQLATVESGSTASRGYDIGEYFCLNGLLYRVTSAISSGGTFTPGTNCEQTTVGEEIQKKAIFSTTSSSPAVLSFGPNTRAIIFATSTNAGGRGIFSTSTNASSTVSVSALVPGNAITMTSSGSTITVSSSTNVVYEILMLAGNLPTIS